ncbi:MAG: nicotinate-nucleotide adenylyltransferase [Bacteroidales bacterium]|jgi:nicotinate-nucleotide adenylyltransferase|nr:nicotinate-nucleotide adenylyltransferase [Bacteroidales bacterium]MBR6092132.1 nicotinate-nucleotide adenylyltransferase [Bacteroidales bacterium]
MKEKVGLFFGSFNPIHNGHLMLANYLAEYGGLDEIWFVVSPQNPFKDKKSLLADRHRLYMVEMAINGDERFQVCDIEFYMPQPSYTIDTLTRLQERHPNTDFYLICGMDNIESFKKWKNYEAILQYHHLMVYPRKGYSSNELVEHPSVTVVEAPEIEVSSTFIRNAIGEGKDVRYFVPKEVYQYIVDMHFYEKK